MAGTTGIPWCTKTWNVVAGCDEVSEGCRFCWARRTANRLAGHPSRAVREVYAGLTERRGREEALAWTGIVRTLPERLEQPLYWRTPQRVFVCSQADLFHPAVSDAFIVRVFEIMASTPQHTFLVLTKRPERMREIITRYICHVRTGENPLPNVQLGITAENQDRLQERIGDLLRTPAAVHWLSLEPLLGAMDPTRVQAGNGAWIDCLRGDVRTPDGREIYAAAPAAIRWLVCGGESGGPPKRRLVESCPPACYQRHTSPESPTTHTCHGTGWAPKPEALQWVRALRDACQAAGVPWYFKGWGGPRATSGGHLLDGRAWQQLPEVACG